jgi:NAD(P)-dependent dehydrogenase (short-subunit alcohol dehydrogenase family)
MNRLIGRIAMITGGALGIGRATAQRIAEEGAAVIVADINEVAGAALVEEFGRSGLSAYFIRLDVSSQEDWSDARAMVDHRFPCLDILVNNAGAADFQAIEEVELGQAQRTLSVGMMSVLMGMKALAEPLKRSSHASVVNIGSVYGSRGGMGTGVAYHAAKGAVGAMTLNAAIHWAPHGIRVNAVNPGFIDTDLLAPIRGTALGDQLLAQVPLGRLGLANEVAAAVAFLASSDASYITGTQIVVDGGLTAR